MEPRGPSDWPLSIALTSSKQHTGFYLFFGVFSIYAAAASILMEQSLWNSPVLPRGCVCVAEEADLLQRDSDDCSHNAWTPKWLKHHIFLPSITLCHCVTSVYL